MQLPYAHRFAYGSALATLALVSTPAFATPQCDLDSMTSLDQPGSTSLGSAIALSRDAVLLGAPASDLGEAGAGAVHVYQREGTSWIFTQTLLPPEGRGIQQFGAQIAVDGGLLAVSAFTYDQGQSRGQVHLFSRSADGWQQEAIVRAAAPGAFFANSLDLEAGLLVVGAPGDSSVAFSSGAVFVFERQGTAWPLRAKIVDPEAEAGLRLGARVALHADRIVAAAPTSFPPETLQVFERSGAGWARSAELLPGTFGLHDSFGSTIALDEQRIFVGAPALNDQDINDGGVFVFERFAAGWEQTQLLKASDFGPGQYFGQTLAYDDGRLLVVAPGSTGVGGRAYLFEDSAAGFVEVLNLEPGVDTVNPSLQGPVALTEGLALFGRSFIVEAGSARPASYVMALTGDCDDDGVVDACAIAAGSALDLDDDLEPDLCEPCLSWNHCEAGTNGSGSEAHIDRSGSLSIAAGDLTLRVRGAVANQAGLFFYGSGEQQRPFGGGFLCVDGALFRFPVVTIDAQGESSWRVDFADPPHKGGTILPGSTWSFQFWYRDPAGAGFNTSDGLRAKFCF